MYYLVYRTTNLINGKHYTGVHATEDKDDGYLGSGKVLKAAIKKYGVENFMREILFEANSIEEMFSKEVEYVTIGEDSYNLSMGGRGGQKGLIVSKETRAKQSAAKKGKLKSSQTKANMSKAQIGKVVSNETKKKISSAKIGNQNLLGFIFSKKSKEKMSVSHKGHKASIETCAKISASNRGRIVSKETREKIGRANAGRIMSEEVRARQRIVAKNRPPISEETRAKMSYAHKNISHEAKEKRRKNLVERDRSISDETKAKISASHIGMTASEEAKASMRAAWIRRKERERTV